MAVSKYVISITIDDIDYYMIDSNGRKASPSLEDAKIWRGAYAKNAAVMMQEAFNVMSKNGYSPSIWIKQCGQYDWQNPTLLTHQEFLFIRDRELKISII